MLIYALISETLPIFNSRKKSYLIIMSLFEFLMAFIVTFLPLHKDNPIGTTLLLSLVTFAMAFIDTVCDGILVVAQRIDP